MSANQHAQLQAALTDLNRQHSAARKRQLDLEQRQTNAQNELSRLGFMQLGKKMMLRAELDSLGKKLAANKQLQDALLRRIADAQEELSALSTSLPAVAAEPVPAEPDDPAAVPEPSMPEEPADEPVPVAADEPVAEPAPVAVDEPAADASPAEAAAPAPVARPAVPRKPRPAGPRKSVPRAAKLGIDAALPLEEQTARLLTHLEAYYPDHSYFAPEVLTTELRTHLNELAVRTGCATPADFLAAHGWQVVTLSQGRALRQPVRPAPGGEPEVIRPKLASVLARLERHYPDRAIARSIQHDHKSLAQDVAALSAHLGYGGSGEMLTAYGFRYDVPAGGRPSLNVDTVIAAVRAAYEGREKPRTIAQISAEHPELAAMLKTLQNQAPKRFGMSLRQYFLSQGVM